MHKIEKIENGKYSVINEETGEKQNGFYRRRDALNYALVENVRAGYVTDVVFPDDVKLTPHNPCVHYSIQMSGLDDPLPTDRPFFNGEMYVAFDKMPDVNQIYNGGSISHSGMTLQQMKRGTHGYTFRYDFNEGEYFILVGSHLMYAKDGTLYDSAMRGWNMRRVRRIWRITRKEN